MITSTAYTCKKEYSFNPFSSNKKYTSRKKVTSTQLGFSVNVLSGSEKKKKVKNYGFRPHIEFTLQNDTCRWT